MRDILTRLWWDGRRGIARHEGVQLELSAAPVIGLAHLAEVDYAPAMRVAQVRESAHGWRDMKPVERAACIHLLEAIAFAARAAASQPSTTPAAAGL